MRKMSNLIKIKQFIKLYQEKILFGIIVILIAIISFRAGEIKEREQRLSEIKVFLNNQEELRVEDKEAIALGRAVQRKSSVKDFQKSENTEECQLVGSKNSNKYHRLDCQWANRIKPENKVCFSSEEDAIQKGYQPASCNK